MVFGVLQLKHAATRAVFVAAVTMPALLLASCAASEPVVNPDVTPPASTEATVPRGAADLAGLDLSLDAVAEGFDQPLYVTSAGDGSGRLFVAEKTGRVWIVRDGEKSSVPWLDMSDRVSTNSERGLLGLAFAPDFATSGLFYIDYTDTNGTTVVARKMATDPASDDPVDATFEEQLLTQEQPFSNHNGGMIAFGPDGSLYVGLGDGGSGGDPNGNGQNRETLLGSMLRLDVDPQTTAGTPAPEVFAWGLRNPWRFSFDREMGDLWIGDVGQNAWEEIDFVPGESIPGGGFNFGWNLYEGTHPYPEGSTPANASGLTMPIVEYDRAAGQSVTGGYVYRGTDYPALVGTYLYGDYSSGRIWGLQRTPAGIENRLLLESDLQVVSFGEDDEGELYLVDFGGTLYRVTAR